MSVERGERLPYVAYMHGEPYAYERLADGVDGWGRGHERFEVRDGDTAPVDEGASTACNRSEWAATNRSFPYGTDIWVSYSLRIEQDSSAVWAVFGQFHGRDDAAYYGAPNIDQPGRSPVLAVQVQGGQFIIASRSQEAADHDGTPIESVHRYTTSFTFGEWHHIVLCCRFARTGNGHLRAWYDGASVFDDAIPLGYNDFHGPWWQYGIYRQAVAETQVAEYANVEVDDADLSFRIADPLPVPG